MILIQYPSSPDIKVPLYIVEVPRKKKHILSNNVGYHATPQNANSNGDHGVIACGIFRYPSFRQTHDLRAAYGDYKEYRPQ